MSGSSPRYTYSTSDYNEAIGSNKSTKILEEQNKIKEKEIEMLKLYKEKKEELSYEKIPIKYVNLKKYNGKFYITIYSGWQYDAIELFKIEKIKNRYYCCKNCVDLWNKIKNKNL